MENTKNRVTYRILIIIISKRLVHCVVDYPITSMKYRMKLNMRGFLVRKITYLFVDNGVLRYV